MKRDGKSLEILIKNTLTRLEDLRWTQKELAQNMGITPNRVSVYLSGKHTPTLEVIEILAAALGLTVAELLTDPAEKSPANNGSELVLNTSSNQTLVNTLSDTIERLARQVQDLETENTRLRAQRGELIPELSRLVAAYLKANPLVRLAAYGFLSGDESVAHEIDRIVAERRRAQHLAARGETSPPTTDQGAAGSAPTEISYIR